jgi:BirA family biotin operon repressor/biotin-[acetyl-CoA-carboxylase] ligase
VATVKKVSESLRDLAARGLLGAEEAGRTALAAALRPTLAGAGSVVPAEVLAESAGLSPADLPNQIGHLRSLGFAVESAGDSGYRLARPFDDLLVPEAVLSLMLDRSEHVAAPSVGLPYHYYAQCGSTSLRLKQEAATSPGGTLVVTDHQTEGRGRLGRSWSSRPGEDLTFSVLLRPATSPEEAPLLSLAAALAVTEVLELTPGLQGRTRVKWPNDVLIDDKKVCGILLESSLEGSRLEWVVAGLGLNVNSDPGVVMAGLAPAERDSWRGRPAATSLLAELGREVPRGALLAELLVRLSLRWAGAGLSDMLTQLRARDALLGMELQVFAGPPDGALVAAGKASGIGPQGELLLEQEDGKIVPVFAGEVTLSVDSSAK